MTNYYHARDVAQRIVNLVRTPVEDVIEEPRIVSQRLYTRDASHRYKAHKGKRLGEKLSPSAGSSRDSSRLVVIHPCSEKSEILHHAMTVGSPMCRKLKNSNMAQVNTARVGNAHARQRVEIIGTVESDPSIEVMLNRYPDIQSAIARDRVIDLYTLSTDGSGNTLSIKKESKEYEKFSEYSKKNRKMADAKYENSYKRKEKNDTSMRRGNRITYY